MFTTSKSFPGVISWFQVEHVETVSGHCVCVFGHTVHVYSPIGEAESTGYCHGDIEVQESRDSALD